MSHRGARRRGDVIRSNVPVACDTGGAGWAASPMTRPGADAGQTCGVTGGADLRAVRTVIAHSRYSERDMTCDLRCDMRLDLTGNRAELTHEAATAALAGPPGTKGINVSRQAFPPCHPDESRATPDLKDIMQRRSELLAERAEALAAEADAYQPNRLEDDQLGHDGEQLDREERAALRRVSGLSTELEDITEVEYRQLRLERVVLAAVWTEGTLEDAENSVRELAALAETAGSDVLDGVIQRRQRPDTPPISARARRRSCATSSSPSAPTRSSATAS